MKETGTPNYFGIAMKEANYAINSLNRDLVYEAWGMAQAFYMTGVITKEEFYQLNDKLVVKGLNNYRNCKLR